MNIVFAGIGFLRSHSSHIFPIVVGLSKTGPEGPVFLFCEQQILTGTHDLIDPVKYSFDIAGSHVTEPYLLGIDHDIRTLLADPETSCL